jgi:hypothetical protein
MFSSPTNLPLGAGGSGKDSCMHLVASVVKKKG